VKLLFDENLSPRLVDLLQSQFPASEHVESAGMRGSPDSRIWQYATDHGLTIVSKDNDFRQLSFLYGPPPKVVWLSVGNAGTEIIARLLRSRVDVLQEFLASPEAGLLVLEIFLEKI
jgi:predicted nuclease of predicted toxin-antitoxin system